MNYKKIVIGILVVGILFWQLGLFNRFNYFTAKIDCWRDSARIVTTEPFLHCGAPCVKLKEKYGFHELGVGCVVTGATIRGIKAYNDEVEKYLEERNGKDWREKYQAELNELIE